MIRSLATSLLLVLSLASSAQSQPIPVRIQAVSATQQTVQTNTIVNAPFTMQVVHASTGAPIANVDVNVFVNAQPCIPLDPNCVLPPPDAYGQFHPVGGAPASSVLLRTDSQGRAASPPYQTGSAPWTYGIAAMIRHPTEQSGGVALTYQHPDNVVIFNLDQIAGGVPPAATAVPTLSRVGLLLLLATLIALTLVNWRPR